LQIWVFMHFRPRRYRNAFEERKHDASPSAIVSLHGHVESYDDSDRNRRLPNGHDESLHYATHGPQLSHKSGKPAKFRYER